MKTMRRIPTQTSSSSFSLFFLIIATMTVCLKTTFTTATFTHNAPISCFAVPKFANIRNKNSQFATSLTLPRPSFLPPLKGGTIDDQQASSSSQSSSSSSQPSQSNQSNNKKRISFDNIANKTILVIGGSGRVGGSIVRNLLQHKARKVLVGGTNPNRYLESKARWKTLNPTDCDYDDVTDFVQVDRDDDSALKSILATHTCDLVVHAAGPFQFRASAPSAVLEAAIAAGVPYVDVCDDYPTAQAAVQRHKSDAKERNVPCILSAGCWPGVSSLMAQRLLSAVQSTTQCDPADLTVDFSFFTAGSGGAGSALLVATFAILAEPALTVLNGTNLPLPPMRDYTTVDFGPIAGKRSIAHLNLLETASVRDVLGVGNVSAKFGTAPPFWNDLLGWMVKIVPPEILADSVWMGKLAAFSLPIVRVVDLFAGATNAMRVEVKGPNAGEGVKEMALYAHENLEPCVGECVVAFCAAVLGGRGDGDGDGENPVVEGGVWFPEEALAGGNDDDIRDVLSLAGVGAHTLIVESSSGLSVEDVWGPRAGV